MAPGAALLACNLIESPADLSQAKGEGKRIAAVLVGDSLTHGSISANYVDVLQDRYQGYGEGGFVNAGVNMRASGEVPLELLAEAASLRPTHGVVVLLGTNDVLRALALLPPLRPSPRAFIQKYSATLREIAERLRAEGTAVTLVSAPILGEDLKSIPCRMMRLAARAARRVASTIPGCRYAPLYEATAARLQDLQGAGLAPQPFSPLVSLALLCQLPWQLYAQGISLDTLRRERNFGLTVDLVHFAEEFAEIAADVITKTLELPRGSPGAQTEEKT